AYDELAAARERARLTAELAAGAREARDALAAEVRAGLAARIDLDRGEAELTDLELRGARAEADARVSELELAFALGFERPVALELAEPATADAADDAGGIEELLALAAERRPELAA